MGGATSVGGAGTGANATTGIPAGAPGANGGRGPAPREATLARNLKSIHDLWMEFTTGVGGRKAAKDFTPAERGAVKFTYIAGGTRSGGLSKGLLMLVLMLTLPVTDSTRRTVTIGVLLISLTRSTKTGDVAMEFTLI